MRDMLITQNQRIHTVTCTDWTYKYDPVVESRVGVLYERVCGFIRVTMIHEERRALGLLLPFQVHQSTLQPSSIFLRSTGVFSSLRLTATHTNLTPPHPVQPKECEQGPINCEISTLYWCCTCCSITTHTQSGAMGDIFNTALKPNVPPYAFSPPDRRLEKKRKHWQCAPHRLLSLPLGLPLMTRESVCKANYSSRP